MFSNCVIFYSILFSLCYLALFQLFFVCLYLHMLSCCDVLCPNPLWLFQCKVKAHQIYLWHIWFSIGWLGRWISMHCLLGVYVKICQDIYLKLRSIQCGLCFSGFGVCMVLLCVIRKYEATQQDFSNFDLFDPSWPPRYIFTIGSFWPT